MLITLRKTMKKKVSKKFLKINMIILYFINNKIRLQCDIYY